MRRAYTPRIVSVLCLLLVLATALVFGQTIGHEFVNYDDGEYVYENPRVAAGLSFTGTAWAFTTVHAANWHPLTWLSHLLDVRLFGLHAGGHHLTSVLLHAAAAVFLFLALLRLTGDPWPSAFVAAVFAVHPLRAESVAWVSEGKDVLSGLFFMLTLWAYAGYARRPFSWVRYLPVAALFALGLMSKPMLVTLPFVLLLLDYWPLRRLSPATGGGAFAVPRRVVFEKLPLLALTAASCVATYFAQGEAVAPIDLIPLSARIANAVVSYAAYMGQLFIPRGLAVFYPHPGSGLPIEKVVVSAVVLAVVSTLALVWRRRYPYLFVGWFWYLGMLVPVIGLVQVGSQAMADRYTYLPQIGLCLSVAWGGAQLTASWRYRRLACGAVAGIALAVLIGLGWRQVSYWRTSETLWTHTLASTGRNFTAHSNLGDALAESGKVEAAIVQYRKALDIRPASAKVNYNLGNSLARKGQVEEAVAHYRRALELAPDHAKAHNNLGIALEGIGQVDAAVVHYRRALEINPGLADALYNLGNSLARKGQVAAAIAEYRRAVELAPDHAKAHNNLGIALEGIGQVDAAVGHYRRALEINPDYADAHHNLGVALANRGDPDAAILHLRKVIEFRPGHAEARRILALLLTQRGK